MVVTTDVDVTVEYTVEVYVMYDVDVMVKNTGLILTREAKGKAPPIDKPSRTAKAMTTIISILLRKPASILLLYYID